jgi:hypothetical protein
MSEQLAVGKGSVLLNAILAPFRATGVQRGGSLIDFIPPRVLGGRVIWTDTDAGAPSDSNQRYWRQIVLAVWSSII